MGLMSWLRSRLGIAEFRREQAQLLKDWEYAQVNDWDLLDVDPLKGEAQAAARLVQTSPEEGFARLLDFANRGSLYSMNYVGWCYGVGTGVAKDTDRSEEWFRRAYEGGSDRGLLEYGAYLHSRDRIGEAESVYEAGWERAFVPAVYRLIRMRLRPTLPFAERLAWQRCLEWAVAAGHPAAPYMLSRCLCRGWFGMRGVPLGVKLLYEHMAAILRGDEDRPIAA